MTNTTPSGADALPSVPEYALTCIHAYGDARADDDGTSTLRMMEAILALRRWGAALSAAQEASAGPTRQQIIDWLDALDIEVTDKQLAGLFDVVAMETTQDAPACLSKPGDPETQSTLPLADSPQRRQAAQAVPQGWKLVPEGAAKEMVDAAERIDWADSDVRGNIHNMWNAMLAAAPAAPQPAAQQGGDTHAFRNFHRALCERFDYCHDERDWRRDQVSLIEHIAKQVASGAQSEEDSLGRTIEQRDTAEGWADGLAGLIGEYFGQEIGEHSSAHNPWQEAKDIIEEALAAQAQQAAPAAQGEPIDTERDAERYRWLRRKVSAHGVCDGLEIGFPSHLTMPASAIAMRDPAVGMDAAIDAARAAQQKGGAE